MASTVDHCKKNPFLFVVFTFKTICESVYCMLGYSGKGHQHSVENSLCCMKCTFTLQWQQYLMPVSCSLSKTLITSNYIKYTSHGYFLQQTVFGSNWVLHAFALMAHHSGVGSLSQASPACQVLQTCLATARWGISQQRLESWASNWQHPPK